MQIVLVIGDSLACPRPWEGVGLRETYAYRLQEKLRSEYYVVNWAAGDNSSNRAASESFLRNFVRASDASYCIVQLGIVDCAPRLMSTMERVVIGITNRLPGMKAVNAAYIKFKARHRYKLTRWFPKTQVTLDQYRINMERLVDELLSLPEMKKVLLINTANAGHFLAEKSFGIDRNIRLFNEALLAIANEKPERVVIVDLYERTKEHPEWITSSDGHHILPTAHMWLANKIGEVIGTDRPEPPQL